MSVWKLRDMSDGRAWYENAMMVGQFGLQAERAVPILLDGLQHSNSIIQAHALIALGMIASQPEKCIPAIVPFLTSPSISERQKAMGALLAFGANALPTKNAIQGALNDSDPWVRNQAATAMKTLAQIEAVEKAAGITEQQFTPANDGRPLRVSPDASGPAWPASAFRDTEQH